MTVTSPLARAKTSNLLPMLIIGSLFFIFGFVTWINGTLIPYLKLACNLKTNLESYLIATAFFIAYTVMALPASLVLRKTGYKKGMSLGLVIMAGGAILFVPAAITRSYPLFLTGLFIMGTGLALLQTASNPYISTIGPFESAATRISIMGICNKSAGIIASLIFGYITLKDTDRLVTQLKLMSSLERNATLDVLAARVIIPYIIITTVLLLLAVGLFFSSLPEIEEPDADPEPGTIPLVQKTSIFQFPHLLLGVLAIFCYVGAEVLSGDTIISYGHSIGIEMAKAKFFTSFTLISMLAGYIIGIFAIPRFLTQANALRLCSWLGILFSALALFTRGYYSIACIAALGLANSLLWPSIFPLAISGLGKFTKSGSALLIMGIAGGAISPLLYGWLSGISNSQHAYALLLPCYGYILYYGVLGHKKGLQTTKLA